MPKDFDFSLRIDKSVWNYKGIRPSNFPEKRIQGISSLLSKTVTSGLVIFFLHNIESEINNENPKSALKNIMNFDGIGTQRKEEMFFNIIMPFMIVYSEGSKIQNFLNFIFETHPPLSENKIIRIFRKNYPQIKIENVKTYMGAILFQKDSMTNE